MANRSKELLGSLQQFCFEKKKKSYAVGSISNQNSNPTPRKNTIRVDVIRETPEEKFATVKMLSSTALLRAKQHIHLVSA